MICSYFCLSKPTSFSSMLLRTSFACLYASARSLADLLWSDPSVLSSSALRFCSAKGTSIFVSASYISYSAFESAFACAAASFVASEIKPNLSNRPVIASLTHMIAFATPERKLVIWSSNLLNITSNGANAAFSDAAISLLRFISFSTVLIKVSIKPTIARIGFAFNVALNTLITDMPPLIDEVSAPVAPERPFVFAIASVMLSA